MKNRNCPNKDACWDYNASNCEGCAVGQKFEKYVRKIKRLQAENAELRATISKMETVEKELRARLDNAVELPCKVGDTVYWVEDDPNIDGICEFTIQGFSFSTNNNDGLRVIIGTFLEPCVDYYKNKQLFFDRSEAEARLAELKGGRE